MAAVHLVLFIKLGQVTAGTSCINTPWINKLG